MGKVKFACRLADYLCSSREALNAITPELDNLDFGSAPGFVINGPKRKDLIATISMILHEIYFDCLGSSDGIEDMLRAALTQDFGRLLRRLLPSRHSPCGRSALTCPRPELAAPPAKPQGVVPSPTIYEVLIVNANT